MLDNCNKIALRKLSLRKLSLAGALAGVLFAAGAAQAQQQSQQQSQQQVFKKAEWSCVKMDSAFDAPQRKAAKASKAVKAAKAYNAAAVIEGHRATSPALHKAIGRCDGGMMGEKLSGYVIDAMMDFASQRLSKNKKSPEVMADFAAVCFRDDMVSIPAGDVTPFDVISLFPMDNQIAILHLKGKDFREFLEFAQTVGAVTSLEAGAGAGASAEADSLEDDRIYRVVTIDYLLRGEFGAQLMKRAQKVDNCNSPLSNTIINNIRKRTNF